MSHLDDLCDVPFHEAGDPQRSHVLSCLANTELFVTLTREPAEDRAELRILNLDGKPAALACDSEDRLSAFWGGPVAYAAMPGRVLAAMLARDLTSILVNPGLPSEMFLDADALRWLCDTLEQASQIAISDELPELRAPEIQFVTTLAQPLSTRLADMAGLADSAALTAAEWPDGRNGHLLIIRGADTAHRAALAKAMAEFLAFLPELAGGVDVAFSEIELPDFAVIFQVPQPPLPEPVPVRDSDAPPRLR